MIYQIDARNECEDNVRVTAIQSGDASSYRYSKYRINGYSAERSVSWEASVAKSSDLACLSF